MFRLELDLSLCFAPPMDDKGNGIRLTRTIELPFPPYSGLAIYGKELEECAPPMGFVIKEVTWDIDRQVFLAETAMSEIDFPITQIAEELASWVARGWKLGSYADAYELDNEPEISDDSSEADSSDTNREDAQMEKWPSMRPRTRPKQFNKLLRAIVRTMAELHNNSAVAYAMSQTHLYLTDKELENQKSEAAKNFREAVQEFETMGLDSQIEWRDRIQRTYPRLDLIVAQL